MKMKSAYILVFLFLLAGFAGCGETNPCNLSCPLGQSCLIVGGNETCVDDGDDNGNCGDGGEGDSCDSDDDCQCDLSCRDADIGVPTCQP